MKKLIFTFLFYLSFVFSEDKKQILEKEMIKIRNFSWKDFLNGFIHYFQTWNEIKFITWAIGFLFIIEGVVVVKNWRLKADLKVKERKRKIEEAIKKKKLEKQQAKMKEEEEEEEKKEKEKRL